MRPLEWMGRARRSAMSLVLVAVLLGAAANTSALAQGGPSTDLASQFGGYKLTSRGNGFLLSFDSPRLFPLGSPLFEVGLPEVQATGSNGPSGYAMASLAYPGSLLANLPAVAKQGSPDAPPLPDYPVRQQSFYPSGPESSAQQIATASMSTATSAISSDGVAQYSAADLQSFFQAGQVTVTAHTGLEAGQVVSRLRSEVTNLNILGIISIGSVVTDIVAAGNGKDANTDGITTVSGVKVLGLDATIDAAGVHLGSPPPAGTPTTTAPPGPLGGILPPQASLGPLNDALKPAADALSALIRQTVGSSGTLDDLLKQAGISIKLLQPLNTKSGAQAQRTANGLLVEITYNGRTEPILSQLIAAVPSNQLPADCPFASTPFDPACTAIPLNISPQAMFNLLKETYVIDLALAPGDVAVQASPPYVATPFVTAPRSVPKPATTVATGATRFTTPSPALSRGGSSGGDGSGSLGNFLPIALGTPIAALAALSLVALTAGVFGIGSRRLADGVLAATARSCPEGREPPDAVETSTGGRT